MPIYIETIENEYDLPNGRYFAEWYRYEVTFRAWDATYVLPVLHFQRSEAVPVTAIVEGYLIDIYLGHNKE